MTQLGDDIRLDGVDPMKEPFSQDTGYLKQVVRRFTAAYDREASAYDIKDSGLTVAFWAEDRSSGHLGPIVDPMADMFVAQFQRAAMHSALFGVQRIQELLGEARSSSFARRH